MKRLFCAIFLLSFFNSLSQSLEQCKTISEVKSLIEGDWKLEGDSKNVVYRFSFSNTRGFIEVLEEMNLPPKAEKTKANEIINNAYEVFKISSKNDAYFIEMQSLGHISVQQIVVLNQLSFTYGKGRSKHVFKRDMAKR
jgi:hypothetical protein